MRGKKPRRRAAPPKRASDARLYGSIAALVVVLGGLVWWSLPGNHAPAPSDDTDAEVEELALEREAGAKNGVLDRPSAASAELAVVANKPEDVIRAAATVTEIGKHLDVRHCGGACDAVRRFMSDEDAFTVEVVKTDDLILPGKDTLDTVAPGLTPSERDSLAERPSSVLIRTHGAITKEQLPARTAFAVAAVLAELLDGFVYDEASRRIETSAEAVAHTARAPLGEPVFVPKHVVVQLYRQEDGTARLLTLGMSRFGCPDVSLRGANMSSGPLLANVLNAVASRLAFGHDESAITITLADVAKVLGKKPSDLAASPANARPVALEIIEPERVEGDPDNELAEVTPPGGASREAWDMVVASLFGTPPSLTIPLDDKELVDVATKARRDLPTAIKRFTAGEGELFVKGPFPIPEESRVDGGAATETLWVAVASCDAQACTGSLSNEPTYATNLAPGKTTAVKRAEAVDWMLQQRDGGTAGGESIKVLRARTAK